jgi:hypothetical protein
MWEDADCKAYGCDREANPAIEALPLCHHHALQIATLYEAIVVANYLERTEEQAEHKVEVKAAKRGNREPSVVYYARIGDYIKIGYTTRLELPPLAGAGVAHRVPARAPPAAPPETKDHQRGRSPSVRPPTACPL